MQLPPFSARSALLYLVGVAALLLIVYLLILMALRAQPRKTVPLETSTAVVLAPGTAGDSAG